MEPKRLRAGQSFGRAWFALTVALAVHTFDEASTGFLGVFNATAAILRARWGWFPLPTYTFRGFLTVLLSVIALCLLLTWPASRGARWLRPLGWLNALILFANALSHTLFTILGHTVAGVTFPRPAPGFYSSPLLFIGSVWLMMRLWKTRAASQLELQ